ncbi:hypothetical protein N665_0745s0002 [Sinapis alba]|nr:hypothetical protein N665_0745s0002 [Sinapis alba]
MILTWLAGKPDKEVYAFQKLIDQLKKTIESLKENEKVYMEEAAMRLEEAKIKYRAKNRDGALSCMRIKLVNEGAAHLVRALQISAHEDLIVAEQVIKEVTQVLRDEDFTVQKSSRVFIYVCFFLLVLIHFLSF